jgi:Carboxypeptidase regulatory-like domain
MHSLSSVSIAAVAHVVKQLGKRHLVVLCGLFLVLPLLAFAQDATVVGTVTDPGGAVVPNVSITFVNAETGASRSITTNDSGQYVVSELRIGHYAIKVEAKGFRVEQRQGVVLNVGDRTRLDFQLSIGSTSETITVEGDAVKVQTDSGEVSDVITGQQVTQLATNGGSIYTLINLTPGASSLQGDFQTPTPVGGDANVSFNGNRPAHNIYLLDGGENLDRGGAGTFSVMPSLESLAEFRALTSNYSADFGLSSAATFTTALKSGSKQLHFSLWEFNRNNAYNARNFFNPAPQKVAELRFNTYGFNVGGPVTFGKLYNESRSKTFFFYNMEWRSLIQGQTLNQTVPPTTEYGGDFAASGLSLAKLHAPYSCQLSAAQQTAFATAGQALSGCTAGAPDTTKQVAFNAGLIPAGLLDPNAQSLLKAGIFPAPNNGNQFQGGANSPTNVREEIVRIDHQFTDKFSVFGHFISEQISQGYGTTQWSGDNVPTVGDTFGNPSYSGVIHTTYVISPTLVNEASFNYNGNRINIIPTGLFKAPADFNFNRVFPGPNADSRIPSINLSGSTGAQYTANWTPWTNKADDYQIRDDISWTRGKHQFHIGGSWALYKKIQSYFANTEGNFAFNGNFTGNDFADYLLGYSSGYTEDAIQSSGHWNNVSWAAYFQDNWRVTNRLTLNLGLRWDGVPHTYEANHQQANFYPNLYNPANAATFNTAGSICASAADPGCTAASPGLGASPNPILAGHPLYLNGLGIDGLNGIPKGLVDNHWAAFGPRIGFAYDLTGGGKTVVRGGFAIMYERVQGNDVYDGATNAPFGTTAGFSNVLLSNPNTSITSGSTLAAPIPVASIVGLAPNNYQLPVSYQYSVGVQRALGAKSILSVSYVGNQNRHQSDFRETNLPDPSLLPGLVASNGSGYNQDLPFLGYRSLKIAENEANGHYNSLQVDLHANVRNDLTLQFGYTLSRAIDPTTGGGNGFDLDPVSNPYLGWKADVGPSIFDRTHIAFTNFVYQIPLLRHSENRLLRTAVGGWELSGIVTMESGAPLNITVNGTTAGSVVQNAASRPDLTGAISYPHTANEWFNPAAFSMPAAGSFGNLGHDALRGPGRDNWNLALFKSFVFSQERGSRLELRFESFNTWNHTQFKGDVQNGGISTALGSSNFGAVTSAFDPRTFQLGAKFVF